MHLGNLQAFAVHPDGELLATGDFVESDDGPDDLGGRVVLWNLAELEPIAEKHLEGVTGIGWVGSPGCIEFSPSGRLLAVVHNTNQLAFLEMPSLAEVGSNQMSMDDGPPGFWLLNDDVYLYTHGNTYVIPTRKAANAITQDMRKVLDSDMSAHVVGRGRSDFAVAILSPDEYDFYSRTQDHYSLALIDAQAKESRMSLRLDVDNTLPDEGFALDASGSKLAYLTRRLLQVADTRTGETRQRVPLRYGFRMKEPVWSPDSRRIVYYHDAGMACVDGDTVIDLGRCKELDFENIPDRGPWTWHPESNGGAFLDDAGRVVRLDPDCKRVVWRSEPHADAQVVAWPFGNIVLLCKRGLKTLDPLTGKLRKQVHW